MKRRNTIVIAVVIALLRLHVGGYARLCEVGAVGGGVSARDEAYSVARVGELEVFFGDCSARGRRAHGLRRAVILVPGKAVEKMTTFSISAFDSAYSLQQIFWLLRLLSKYVFNKFLQSLQRK